MAMHWQTWSTLDVERGHRDYWIDVIRQSVVAADLDCSDPGFSCSMASRTIGSARYINFTASGRHRVSRDYRQIRQGDDSCYMLGFQKTGTLQVEQGGDRAVIAQGDLVALHSGYPFELTFTEMTHRRVVLMPRQLLDRFLPKHTALTIGRPIVLSPNRAGLRAGADLICHLTDVAQHWESEDCSTSLECLAQFIGSALTQQRTKRAPVASKPRIRGADVVDLIGRRSREFDIAPAMIARQLGISLRSLHRLLAQEGKTFSGALLAARLEGALDLLRTTHPSERTLTMIAMESGFCDAAHFSRTFRQRFGVSPSMFRSSDH